MSLPPPYSTEPERKPSKIIEPPEGWLPTAPEGFTVSKFVSGLDQPRWVYQAPNGDIFISESKANQITLVRDQDQDGRAEFQKVFKDGLNRPFGMLVLNGFFYIANQDALLRFPYKAGMETLTGKSEKLVDLPAGGYNHHWTRNVIADPEGSKIYISVGSASNVGEYGMDKEKRRACILEVNPDGTGEKVYASGLRNPVGMDWDPVTGKLWTAVNERDELGDHLVPDFITSVKEGGFYGWPYSYFGQIVDPRMEGKRPDLVKEAIVPDVPLTAHSASLGLVFYNASAFPEKYHHGAFIGQHGSWNRSEFAGYRAAFVPFKNGKPEGGAEDFLTGFIANEENSEVYGRPVCTTVLKDGSLLVSDDAANVIWRVAYGK